MRSIVFALAVLLGASPAWAHLIGPRHALVQRNSTTMGDWRLDIAHNRFSDELVCRLRARDGHAIYLAHAVGFRFKHGWDVANAVYRLDDGAPRQARDDLPELIVQGTPVDRGGMDNANGGIVWVPFARLAESDSIAIEARPDRAARVFHFRGLIGLHEIAVARGCTPDSRFVER